MRACSRRFRGAATVSVSNVLVLAVVTLLLPLCCAAASGSLDGSMAGATTPAPRPTPSPTPRPELVTLESLRAKWMKHATLRSWLDARSMGIVVDSRGFDANATHDAVPRDALVDGVVFRVASPFALTSRALLTANALAALEANTQSLRIVCAFGTVRVKRAIAQSDAMDAVVMLELDGGHVDDVISITGLLPFRPVHNFVYSSLSIVSFDAVLGVPVMSLSHTLGSSKKPVKSPDQRLYFASTIACGVVSKQTTEAPTSVPTSRRLFEAEEGVHESNEPENDDAVNELCVVAYPNGSESKADTESSSGSLATRSSVLFYENLLVGLPMPQPSIATRPNARKKAAFARVGAAPSRAFIDGLGRQEIWWFETNLLHDDAKYPPYIAHFYDDRENQCRCQGALIAPQFVLTTATCIKLCENLEIVRFFSSTESVSAAVSRENIIEHPNFNRTGDPMFDTALVRLNEPVPIHPLSLEARVRGSDHENLTRLDVAPPQAHAVQPRPAILAQSIKVTAPTACVETADGINTSSAVICGEADPSVGGPIVLTDATPPSRAALEAGVLSMEYMPVMASGANEAASTPAASTSTSSSDAKTIGASLVNTASQGQVSLVGLAVTGSGVASGGGIDMFVSVARSANFINAFVSGQSWGSHDADAVDGAGVGQLPADKRFVIGLRAKKNGQNFCGGALIAPSYVLTAAHCVTDGLAEWVTVGATGSSGAASEPIPIDKSRIRVHPNYDSTRYSFDAAILELNYPASAAQVVLNLQPDFPQGEPATMYGYGVVSPSSKTLSPLVRIIDLPVWSKAKCERDLPGIDGSMLCAGGEAGKDACTGDSGGPLVQTVGDQSLLIGMVSAGFGCGQPGVPGIYTRASSLVDFINAFAVGPRWENATSPDRHPQELPTPTMRPSTSSRAGDNKQDPFRGGTTPRDLNGTASSSPVTKPTARPFIEHNVDLSKLPESVSKALMDFIIGDQQQQQIGWTMAHELKTRENELSLFSSGDLSALLAVIKQHKDAALSQRRSRFERPSNNSTSTSACRR